MVSKLDLVVVSKLDPVVVSKQTGSKEGQESKGTIVASAADWVQPSTSAHFPCTASHPPRPCPPPRPRQSNSDARPRSPPAPLSFFSFSFLFFLPFFLPFSWTPPMTDEDDKGQSIGSCAHAREHLIFSCTPLGDLHPWTTIPALESASFHALHVSSPPMTFLFL